MACTAKPKCRTSRNDAYPNFDIGTDPARTPMILACTGGCATTFDGTSPAGSALVGGTKHYFASGSYVAGGDSCVPSAGTDPGTSTSAVPSDACAAGQTKGMVNGKAVCAASASASAPAPAKAAASSSMATTTNPDGSTTKVETTTKTNPDGTSSTTTTTTTTNPDGSTASQTVKTGTEVDKEAEEADDDAEKEKCELNSSDKGCGGEVASIGDLRTKGTKTVAEVMTTNKNVFLASAFGTAVGGFFTVSSGGTCPSWVWNLDYFNTSVNFDLFCTSWAVAALLIMKTALLLTAAFFAFRIAIE